MGKFKDFIRRDWEQFKQEHNKKNFFRKPTMGDALLLLSLLLVAVIPAWVEQYRMEQEKVRREQEQAALISVVQQEDENIVRKAMQIYSNKMNSASNKVPDATSVSVAEPSAHQD